MQQVWFCVCTGLPEIMYIVDERGDFKVVPPPPPKTTCGNQDEQVLRSCPKIRVNITSLLVLLFFIYFFFLFDIKYPMC